MRPLYLIYIPGLGDQDVRLQKKAVNSWRLWGVEAELFEVKWYDKEPWPPKFETLLKRIDALTAQNKRVALVGASAGATAVINAYAARQDKITGCVIIAGKVNHPEAIDSRYNQRNPAFVASAYACQDALKSLDGNARERILSMYSIRDGLVHKEDSHIPGAKNRTLPTIGHAFTIAIMISLGAKSFIKFLKRLKY